MRNHVAEFVEGLPSAQELKVHAQMCSQLLKLVIRVSKILPEIEDARPRCSSGLETLSQLNSGFSKAKTLLQYCSESSALYLALTGDAILSRCKKSRKLLEQSLSQVQNDVPVILAAKISGIAADLRSAVFYLDPSDEEAGRLLRELLHSYGTTVGSTEAAIAAFRTICSLLRISSEKALVIERRSINKLLQKLGESEPNKRTILSFFLLLLNKYGKNIVKEQKDNCSSEREDPLPFSSSSPYHLSNELYADCRSNKAQIDILSRPVPPEEFLCPLSLRLMHDPVVIASGQTYERMWIQKWLDEGNDTCPKTNVKLPNFSITSNTGMKDLIMKWCAMHSMSVPDRKVQEALGRSWTTSTLSIASLGSSMNDLNLPLDFSNISLGSRHGSDTSCAKASNDTKPLYEIDMVFLSKFSTLPWDSRCNAVEHVKKLLKRNDESWLVIPSGKFIQLILRFLKDACDLQALEAQMTGCLMLFEFVQKHGNSASYLKEDEYNLLASLLDTEVSKQSLSILELLSIHQNCHHKIATSRALVGLLNILDSQISELLEPALKILSNLSSNSDARSLIIPCELIPKLIPLFDDNSLARHCITILKNLCETAEARKCVAETEGCIRSIATLLEGETDESQESAVSVLLILCSQHVLFCQQVMDEGVIPGLVEVSAKGTEKAKAMALELLRILKDEVHTVGDHSGSCVNADFPIQQDDKKPPRKVGFLGKLFSKSVKKKT